MFHKKQYMFASARESWLDATLNRVVHGDEIKKYRVCSHERVMVFARFVFFHLHVQLDL
jgi:hypothetical protein